MREFKLLLLSFSLLFFINGCNSYEKASVKKSDSCSTCNMKILDSKLFTSELSIDNEIHNFDDIGCMVLFAKQNGLNLKELKSKVFTTDTRAYINSYDAHYKIDEETPMSYGFSAYQNSKSGAISFDEVIVKMLRGEHMANPKIRKQILGSENAR
ncbi:MAG: hypothetical protein A2513_07970 [Sulfurimonas sp. RIFOXYD12_FULL_33_39]|uniref:hypothetical protein n=1 Tax=unclassified Sulfurimonas TaxID=2623549 RepID=UPI0008C1A6C0|nr:MULTISPECIES: hypothetical protein [unclassified Sulfurimonas]OHE05024.1 MAG: hypothetical protein A3G74_03615 [Sulfurimonas sp. RIFCSPLOWO2_12_FULL_34_6]OHE10026.1 MAG: hypothetical protein A2513_07970 [Sulfurimonas sp. RIFOXYD12_FULL_33_39]OHE14753.1 MAG: hypothetical protein A2530_02510 [Sulfurimonas sp. RIFOXYD2_FULL_34_21]